MEEAVSKYLTYLDIPISKTFFKKCLLSHPDYPSLLSIADTLKRLSIDHQIVQIEQKDLFEIPFPYMLHLDKQGGTFILVKNQMDLDSLQDDKKYWNGVILKVAPVKSIVDEQNNRQLEQEKLQRIFSTVLVITLVGLLSVSTVQYSSWLNMLLFATVLGGAMVSYLLLAKDFGITYKPVETFCNAGKRTNCDRILHAEDAKLLSFFSFTDAATSYFSFQLIIVGLFIPQLIGGASFLTALAAVGLLTIPVIVFSLYYQYIKAQAWCRLCLLVDAILIAQLAIYAILYYHHALDWGEVKIITLIIFILLFGAVTSSLILLKNKLKATNDSRRAETVALRVKHDPTVFTNLLMREKKINTTLFDSEIWIGSATAPLRFIMVANLYCNPCHIAYQTVTQLIAMYPQKVRFTIRLTRGMDNEMGELSASTYLIRYWQQYIQGKANESTRTQAFFQDWYSQMDPKAFMKQYAARGDILTTRNGSASLELQHYQWVQKIGIKSTPTFFLSGHKIPDNYAPQDLLAMLPGLAVLFEDMEKDSKSSNKIVLSDQEENL